VGADAAALAVNVVQETAERCRIGRLTRNQHVLFELGELMTRAEIAANFARYAAGRSAPKYQPFFAPAALKAMSRICAREAALDVLGLAVRLVRGMDAVMMQALPTSSAPSGPVPSRLARRASWPIWTSWPRPWWSKTPLAPSRAERE